MQESTNLFVNALLFITVINVRYLSLFPPLASRVPWVFSRDASRGTRVTRWTQKWVQSVLAYRTQEWKQSNITYHLQWTKKALCKGFLSFVREWGYQKGRQVGEMITLQLFKSNLSFHLCLWKNTHGLLACIGSEVLLDWTSGIGKWGKLLWKTEWNLYSESSWDVL